MRAAGMLIVVALALACARGEGGVVRMTPAELAGRLGSADAPIVLDVRTPEEFHAGHIPGAINIPHTELASRLGEVEAYRNGEMVVHCRSGKRAGIARQVLRDAGFEQVLDLEGHMQAWQAGGYPTE